MWILSIRYPGNRPREYQLQLGDKITFGRRTDNHVVLADTSVSRAHAQIEYDSQSNQVVIRDLGSANGTFVNLYRIPQHLAYELGQQDVVRIGLHEITLHRPVEQQQAVLAVPAKQLSTKELTQDALDRRAALVYRVAHLLNTERDKTAVLRRVSQLLQRFMKADKCELFFAHQFQSLRERGFSETIARMAVEQGTAVIFPDDSGTERDLGESAGLLLIHSALCVPVMSDQNITALVYMYRTDPRAKRFNRHDLLLAETVGHMVALALERMRLSERIREEEKLRRLLQYYLAPARVADILQNYLRTGRLPGLTEEHATILIADIIDSANSAERIGVQRLNDVLEPYHHPMSQIVSDHGGFLNRYWGDGLMAVFGMAADSLEPEHNAIQASLQMFDLIESASASASETIGLGIGVNSGPVVAGYVRTRDRVEFTVLGDTVNVAFELQSLSRPNRLLVGPNTYKNIKGSFALQEIGFAPIQGRETAIRIHQVQHLRTSE